MKKCVLMFAAFIVAIGVAAILDNNEIAKGAGELLLDSEKQDSLFAQEVDGVYVAEN